MRWLAGLAAVALVAGVGLVYANATVFDADGFAARADEALRGEVVSAEVAARITDEVVRGRPDLVAVRPLIQTAAQGVVRGGAFRSVLRGAARDVHRSVFDRDAATVTLTLSDVGLLLIEALEHQRPELAGRVPASLRVQVATAASGFDRAALRASELAERGRIAAWLAWLVAVVSGSVVVLRGRRAGVLRLGVAVAACGGLAAAVGALAARLAGGSAAGRAALGVWLDPLAVWWAGLAVAGAIAALAATSALPRPIELARRFAASQRVRTAAPVVALALGAALVVWPRTVLEAAGRVAGLTLAFAGAAELLRRAGEPVPRRARAPSGRRLAAAIALIAGALALAFVTSGAGSPSTLSGRCNGSVALCSRTLDQVTFLGTHNSMAAEGEPGWLFPAQNAGMEAQLDDGVRALLIDTHYGHATPRGVATDLSGDTKSRAKITEEVGAEFVATAERLRARIGWDGTGTREIFLCHAFCEVGATRALGALEGVHRWLVANPEEVLILSIEDDTAAADTTKLLRDSGLIREVYRGAAEPPWPTLRELIERDERVLVLIENDPGEEAWMHEQAQVAQETPYHFSSAAELAAPDSCRPNRGGTEGSLLLVNHWVDTSPAPRVTIAREVNARRFVEARLARCRAADRPFPTILAVDFYRDGDALILTG